MKKILFFDTETTGLLPKEEKKFENINLYPRLVQLAFRLHTIEGNLIEANNFIVYPDGFTISNSSIHGISTTFALENGEDIFNVLEKFKIVCEQADLIVCHNYFFDSLIIQSEMKRVGVNDFFLNKNSFCTMTECSEIAKTISLQDLHFKIFNSYFENNHNAAIDVEITEKCFFEMIKKSVLILNENIIRFTSFTIADINFKLDENNSKFYHALTLINETTKSIFLTGKAGTGKTTLLKYLKSKKIKQTVIVAPTGVAAINAGGQTINSFFQLPFRPFLPDDEDLKPDRIFDFLNYTTNKRALIRKLEVLIIDEVSMVKADVVDCIDKILRIFRKKLNSPFGGVQIVFIGDLFQLPPIEGDDWAIIAKFYDSPYFFSSKIVSQLISANALICLELDKVYRQTEVEFIEILNRIRVGQHTSADLSVLNQRVTVEDAQNEIYNNFITLSTTNAKVDSVNTDQLLGLPGDATTYNGLVTGNFPDSMKTAPQQLQLKLHAQVMLLKNKGSNYNGQIGKIVSMNRDKVEILFESELVTKQIEQNVWSNIEYKYDNENHKIVENIKGSYTQFPLKLAWAITVHKSQGMTFNKVIADVGNAFASGQVYVALSRCTSLSGLKLKTMIPQHAIRIDRRVISFSKIQTPDTVIVSHINSGKADVLYVNFKKQLLSLEIKNAFLSLGEAIKYRNDIFSEIFEKFTKLHIQKYKNYQSAIGRLNLKNFQFKEIIAQLEQELQESNICVDEITLKYNNTLKRVNLLNKTILQKDKHLEEKNNHVENLNQSIIQLSTEAKSILIEKNKISKKYTEKEKECEKLRNEIYALEAQIANINSKWYVKFFK